MRPLPPYAHSGCLSGQQAEFLVLHFFSVRDVKTMRPARVPRFPSDFRAVVVAAAAEVLKSQSRAARLGR